MIAYDVSDARRRARLVAILLDVGRRVGLSVFVVELTVAEGRALRERVARVIDPSTDRVHFFPLCEHCRDGAERVGRAWDETLPRGPVAVL